MRQQRSVFGEPCPVDAAENLAGQTANLRMAKVLPAGEHSAEQNRSVHRRYFRVPNSFTRLHVGPVEEKAAMNGQLPPDEAQRREHTPTCLGHGNVAALLPYAESGQPEAGRGNAPNHSIAHRAHVEAISYQSGLRVCLLPEKQKVCMLDLFQQLRIICGEAARDGRRRRARGLRRRENRQHATGNRDRNPESNEMTQKHPARNPAEARSFFFLHLLMG